MSLILNPEEAPFLKTTREGQYLFCVRFDTNNTSAPDGVNPSSGDIVVARTGVGVYTITFAADERPTEFHGAVAGLVEALASDGGFFARPVSYSAGVLTVNVYQRRAVAYASGTITCVAKADLVDTDYMTLNDGIIGANLFEFDTAGDGVTSGRVQVDVSGDTTAADVAATLKAAIDATFPTLSVVDNLDGTLSLTHKVLGTVGNQAMTENVADGGFAVTGMSGGSVEEFAVADTNNRTVVVMALFSRVP